MMSVMNAFRVVGTVEDVLKLRCITPFNDALRLKIKIIDTNICKVKYDSSSYN